MVKRKSNVTGTHPTAGDAAGAPAPDSMTVEALARLIETDRLDRGLSWPKYAAFLGIPQATVYKISRQVRNRPHQTTIAKILRVIRQNPTTGAAATPRPKSRTGVRTRGKAAPAGEQSPGIPVVPERCED
jgi:DNA-binding transcriptional regulator YiaG